MTTESSILTKDELLQLLNAIPDPEVPAISIVELGVVRDIHLKENKEVEISITPTYSGCPALKMMEDQIRSLLTGLGFNVSIKTVFKPAWTTEWMSEETKEKLRKYGIAPPEKLTFEHLLPLGNLSKSPIACPFCHSLHTHLTSQFGSTACKALHYCDHCQQPFEHFKCH